MQRAQIRKNDFFSGTYVRIFALTLFLKIALLILFSSDYQNKLFIPFIEQFLTNLGNPWQYFYKIQVDKFPYPPLMLYITSLFYLPCHLLGQTNIIIQNIFFKLPTLAADIVIVYTLIKMFPNKLKEILLFYFASPVIIYASYMHSQLDLLPMAILLFSVYLLTVNKPVISAVVFGLAVSTKFHVIAALPLIIIYVFKNYKKIYVLPFIFIPAVIYLLLGLPYLFSEGYLYMVLQNPKQMLIFDVVYAIGNLKIYIPIFVATVIYARFLAYRKINTDLFYSFLGIVFCAFVFLVFPSPAWYIWIVPFLSLFLIKYYAKHPAILYLYISLNVLYLSYFILFYIPDYNDLTFLNMPLNIKIYDGKFRNITYTVLEVALCATLYSLYKFGVKSNSVYKKEHNFIIGIGGDSAAGKSVLLSDIKLLLGGRLLDLEGDADHKWTRADENWQVFTHLDPKANYLHRQARNLLALKLGGSVVRGEYDHTKGAFAPSKKINPREFIILSGLHVFYLPISRKIIDFKIYLDTEEKLRRHWKVARDTRERGYPKERALEQIEKRAEDAKKFIHPQKEFADMIISYSAQDDFEAGEISHVPILKLKISMDSSIHIEKLVNKLIEKEIGAYWDYAADLKSQYLILHDSPGRDTIREIAKDIIPNIEELVAQDAVWLDGYRGVAQLIVILVMSEKMKEENGHDEV